MVVNIVISQGPQHVSNKAPALNPSSSPHVDNDDIINIQLLYNSNQSIKIELWNSNFLPIFLYKSLKYLFSDTTNLKKSIIYIAKYIQNKKIDMSKFNNIKNLEGISKAA